MTNWYFIVGLVVAGATGYILYNKLPQDNDSQQLAVIIPFGMILLWGPALFLALGALIVGVGILLGKIFLKGSEGVYPRLVAIWKAFD